MSVKMICSDLDGTLLQYGKKTLEPLIFSQIEALADRGILFCPASGRQYTSLRALFAPVADRCAFLCENGGVLYKEETCIGKTPMPRALAEEIARDLWERSEGEGEVMLSGQNCAYLMETENNFYFVASDGQGLMIDKHHLRGGTADELRAWLEEKSGKTTLWVGKGKAPNQG